MPDQRGKRLVRELQQQTFPDIYRQGLACELGDHASREQPDENKQQGTAVSRNTQMVREPDKEQSFRRAAAGGNDRQRHQRAHGDQFQQNGGDRQTHAAPKHRIPACGKSKQQAKIV